LDGRAVYDEEFDITWVADGRLALDEPFDLTINSVDASDADHPIASSGRMTWDNAHLWIAAMNAASYLGASDWRLPVTLLEDTTCDSSSGGGTGKNCEGSEMGHLFNVQGVTDQSQAPFFNVQSIRYWSGTTSPTHPDSAFWVRFSDGYQGGDGKASAHYAFAVRPGDIRLIPEPSTALLLAAGLGVLAAARRRR
jgi:hypothetical protein